MIKLRPSSSHIWTACALFPRLMQEVSEFLPSDAAREGTCAAWVAEQVLAGEAESAASLLGASHENGWVVDDEMVDLIQNYIDELRSDGVEVVAEKRVYLNDMIDGTPDAFALLLTERTLKVKDLKYGYLIVEPYRNTQVSIYAGAILRNLLARGVVVDTVEIGIYQPRAFHPDGVYRKWIVSVAEFMRFVEWIEQRGVACQDPQAKATPGFHCEHCDAAAACTAVTHTIYKTFRVLSDERPMRLTGEQLAAHLDFLELAEKLVKGARNSAMAEAEARRDFIPGYGYDHSGKGNRRFTASALVIAAKTGVDPYAPRKLATPAEVIRRGKKAGIADIEDRVNALAEQPSIPPKFGKIPTGFFEKAFKK